MPRRSHGPPSSVATTLVSSPPRPGQTNAGAHVRDGDEHAGVLRLREAIRRTRAELKARERRDGWIARRFETEIRPREQAFTAAVCRTTARLVTHHERTDLGPDERTLLGLWINENLQGLAAHPFAPRAATDELARRWRRHLGAAHHPLDASLASLYAACNDGAFAGADDGTAASRAPDDADGVSGEPVRGADDREARRRSYGSPHERGRSSANPDERSRRGRDQRSGTGDAEPARRDPGHTVSRLFRRLAHVLHPDRELDETRRQVKHRLMSDCLRARDERDVETLLSLHLEHVGALPDDLTDDDPAELARLLRRQLDTLRQRLRPHATSVGLDALIVTRYAATDIRESERRFGVHADALDEEIERFEGLEQRIDGIAGLREALATRRALELDRLVVDELTGASG